MDQSFVQKKVVCILFLLLLFYEINAQKGAVGCFTPAQIESFYKSQQSVAVSSQVSGSEWRLTVNTKNAVYTYKGLDFDYEMAEWKSSLSHGDVYLRMYSKPDHSNIIELQVNAGCFRSIYTAVSKTYQDKYTVEEDSLYKYRIFETKGSHVFLFSETTSGLPNYKICCFNKVELDSIAFVILEEEQRKKEEYLRKFEAIQQAFLHADSLHEIDLTDEAIAHVHQRLGLLIEYNEQIEEKITFFKNERIRKIIAKLVDEGDALYRSENWQKAKMCYDSLLAVDPEHNVALERLIEISKKIDVLEQREGTVYSYETLNYDSYSEFQMLLEKKVNESVAMTPNGKIIFRFQIEYDLLGENRSSVFTSFDTIWKKKQPIVDSTLLGIASSYHFLLTSPPLRPCQIEGIFVNAKTVYPLTLNWKTEKVKMIRKPNVRIIKPKSGFQGIKRTMETRIGEDSLFYSVGKYVFSMKTKSANTNTSYDISLNKYKTVGPEAMLYSMLYPGAGTLAATRGEKGAGALVSFTIFGGLGVASYLLFQDALAKEKKGEEMFKNATEVFQYISYGTLGIAGVIYVTDMFIALSKGCKNLKQSKALRKALKEGPIEIIHENVTIPLQ